MITRPAVEPPEGMAATRATLTSGLPPAAVAARIWVAAAAQWSPMLIMECHQTCTATIRGKSQLPSRTTTGVQWHRHKVALIAVTTIVPEAIRGIVAPAACMEAVAQLRIATAVRWGVIRHFWGNSETNATFHPTNLMTLPLTLSAFMLISYSCIHLVTKTTLITIKCTI